MSTYKNPNSIGFNQTTPTHPTPAAKNSQPIYENFCPSPITSHWPKSAPLIQQIATYSYVSPESPSLLTDKDMDYDYVLPRFSPPLHSHKSDSELAEPSSWLEGEKCLENNSNEKTKVASKHYKKHPLIPQNIVAEVACNESASLSPARKRVGAMMTKDSPKHLRKSFHSVTAYHDNQSPPTTPKKVRSASENLDKTISVKL